MGPPPQLLEQSHDQLAQDSSSIDLMINNGHVARIRTARMRSVESILCGEVEKEAK